MISITKTVLFLKIVSVFQDTNKSSEARKALNELTVITVIQPYIQTYRQSNL